MSLEDIAIRESLAIRVGPGVFCFRFLVRAHVIIITTLVSAGTRPAAGWREASRQSGLVGVVDGDFERPVATSEFGGDEVGDGLADDGGDVVDVFVVGAVGAVAVFGKTSREVVFVWLVDDGEGVGGVAVDGVGEGEFGFGFGGEYNGEHFGPFGLW